MRSVTNLLSPEFIRKSATPSNYKLGEEIAKKGTVEFVEYSPSKVVVKVSLPGKSDKRTVTLKSTADGLEYKCTCSNKPDWFCKHCVAASLKSWERAATEDK